MLEIPKIDDFHVHLRQGDMMKIVAPMLSKSGCRLAYVMPNLQPPICTTEQALAYKQELQLLEPDVEFLMTLYLNPDLTADEIRKASKAGIKGVKSYPRGVTTNSEGGIESYTSYYHVFEAMEEVGMILNLHGEIPSDDNSVCILNAEELFLNHLVKLHHDFPRLKIVLEHATTKAAVETVKSLGDTVGCTITLHHLELVVDDWAGCCFNFCKPVAKYPSDRLALREVVKTGHPRFFLGTDSAPHPRSAKLGGKAPAGVFTTPFVAPYLMHIMDGIGALDKLEGFACELGRKFYGIDINNDVKELKMVKDSTLIPERINYDGTNGPDALVPFLAGKILDWKLQ